MSDIKELRKGSNKSPCCNAALLWKVWNGLVRIRTEKHYPSICSECKKEYNVKAPKE